jgi:hypothetical protein
MMSRGQQGGFISAARDLLRAKVTQCNKNPKQCQIFQEVGVGMSEVEAGSALNPLASTRRAIECSSTGVLISQAMPGVAAAIYLAAITKMMRCPRTTNRASARARI